MVRRRQFTAVTMDQSGAPIRVQFEVCAFTAAPLPFVPDNMLDDFAQWAWYEWRMMRAAHRWNDAALWREVPTYMYTVMQRGSALGMSVAFTVTNHRRRDGRQ